MILVTGANGQLGSEIRLLTAHESEKYIFTDVQELDITDLESVLALFEQYQFQYCINAAAYTAVDKAETDQDLCFAINVKGVENLAKACQKYQAKFIHVSTDFVFDGSKPSAYLETDAPNPLNVYGKTKLEGEQIAFANCNDTLVMRTAWVYSTFGKNFVKTMIRLGQEKPSLNVVADQIGTPTYARDLANAILYIINKIPSTPNWQGIYHFTNEGVASWYDFAYNVLTLSGFNTPIYPIQAYQYPTPAQRPAFSLLDKNKIKNTFGVPMRHWQNALQECLTALQKNS